MKEVFTFNYSEDLSSILYAIQLIWLYTSPFVFFFLLFFSLIGFTYYTNDNNDFLFGYQTVYDLPQDCNLSFKQCSGCFTYRCWIHVIFILIGIVPVLFKIMFSALVIIFMNPNYISTKLNYKYFRFFNKYRNGYYFPFIGFIKNIGFIIVTITFLLIHSIVNIYIISSNKTPLFNSLTLLFGSTLILPFESIIFCLVYYYLF